MIIKYEDIGDKVLMQIPAGSPWEIRYRLFSDPNDDYYKLCLITGDREITLDSADKWCQGRPKLPDSAVGVLFEEMIEVIAAKLEQDPDLKFLDIEEIEAGLIASRYEKLWLELGFITLSENGGW